MYCIGVIVLIILIGMAGTTMMFFDGVNRGK